MVGIALTQAGTLEAQCQTVRIEKNPGCVEDVPFDAVELTFPQGMEIGESGSDLVVFVGDEPVSVVGVNLTLRPGGLGLIVAVFTVGELVYEVSMDVATREASFYDPDNDEFCAATGTLLSCADPKSVPVLSGYGLLAMASLLFLLGCVLLTRRVGDQSATRDGRRVSKSTSNCCAATTTSCALTEP